LDFYFERKKKALSGSDRGFDLVVMDSWVVDGGRCDYKCPECWSTVFPVRTNDSFDVCPDCGLVITATVFDRLPFVVRALKGTYKRIFHWNERMALFKMHDPWIPDDIMDLVEAEAIKDIYPNVDDFDYSDVAKVLGAVVVPLWMQEKYRSQKYKCKPMKDLLRFREKWLQIKWRLTGRKPVDPPDDVIERLTEYFKALQLPWSWVNMGRNNFINYNLVIIIGLEFIGYNEYIPFFPMMRGSKKNPKKLVELCLIMRSMFEILKWPLTSTIIEWTELCHQSALISPEVPVDFQIGKKRKRNLQGGQEQKIPRLQ
jgi:hypothetical protein